MMLKKVKKISDRYRAGIHARRPLMNYTGYSDRWTSVEIDDHYAGSWQWGQGPYYDWCDDNCTDSYNIVKYDRNKIWGRFRSDKDAVAFKLRWA